ncbi:MAG: M20 family metallopeptidase [Chloroflexota bacterium]
MIPDTAELRGTVRTFTPGNREMLERRIGEMVRGIATAMRAEAEFHYQRGYPATVNDPDMTRLAWAAAAEVVGEDNVIESPLMMGAEDFSYFLEQVPGCYWFVGSRNEDQGLVWGHHHPRFDLDERAMAIGIESLVRTALSFLG